MNKQSNWSQEEIFFLKENFQRLGVKECSTKLKRSDRSIQMKACRLRLLLRKKPQMGHLFCSDCKKEKPIEEFYQNQSKKTKRQYAYYCKGCGQKRYEKYRISFWSSNTIQQHKKVGCSINFTPSELTKKAKETKHCLFCKCELGWHNNGIQNNSPTLERLNNDTNLTLQNIAILCYQCNSTKRDRTLLEFANYISLIKPILDSLVK